MINVYKFKACWGLPDPSPFCVWPAQALFEIIEHHAVASLPDYQGGGTVNLMASIAGAKYPQLR